MRQTSLVIFTSYNLLRVMVLLSSLSVLLNLQTIAFADVVNENVWYGSVPIVDGGWDNRAKWKIDISGVPDGCTITDITVKYKITHGYRGDLVVELSNEDALGYWEGHTLRDRENGDASGTFEETVSEIDDFDGGNPNGEWWLLAWDDALGDEGQIDSWEIWIYYTAPKADLEVTSIEIDGSASSSQHFDPGENVGLRFQAHNDGNKTSKRAISMKWWYGTSESAKTHAIANGEVGSLNGLSPDEYEWESDFSWSVPNTPDTYWLTVVIDDDNQEEESDENNNEETLQFFVDPQPIIELTLYTVSDASGTPHTSNPGVAKTSFMRGESVRVTLRANNIGDAVPGLVTLNVATPGSHPSPDIYDSHTLGQDVSDDSVSGSANYYAFTFQIPDSAQAGDTYDIIGAVRADEWEEVLDVTGNGASSGFEAGDWLINQIQVIGTPDIRVEPTSLSFP